MAYETEHLQLLIDGFSNTDNQVWALNTVDTAANVNTDGYISDGVAKGMNQGEIVFVKTRGTLPRGAVSAVSMMYVASVNADGSVNLTDGTAITSTDAD